MITIKVDGLDRVQRYVGNMEKQARFALAVALTRTAEDVKMATYDHFRQVFDRPTPMTMKSLYKKSATKTTLEAMVYMKDQSIGGKNPRSMAEILGHQFTGGSRERKALEYLLIQNGFMNPGEFAVPGSAAKLDAYGNMNRGQIQQIISQLKIRRLGFDQASTNSKRSKRNQARAGLIFWSYGKGGSRVPLIDKATGIEYGYRGGSASHLAKGAWMRTGVSVKPLLIVVRSVQYRRRINWERIAQPVIARRFDIHFETELQKALATAR